MTVPHSTPALHTRDETAITPPFSAKAADTQKTDTRHYSRGRFHQSLLAVQVAKQG